jgi:hypothetical protein
VTKVVGDSVLVRRFIMSAGTGRCDAERATYIKHATAMRDAMKTTPARPEETDISEEGSEVSGSSSAQRRNASRNFGCFRQFILTVHQKPASQQAVFSL